MNLLIASDIHGSAFWCKKMLEACDKENADRLLLLGDILYHGPRNDLPKLYNPKEVINMLNTQKSKILCVRGNCDTEVDQMVLDFPIMADYAVVFINNRLMYATHGHKFGQENLPLSDNDIVLSGHTHIPECENKSGHLLLNPGSVSIPKNGSPNSYMTFDGNRFLWKSLIDDSVFKEYHDL